MLNEMCSLLSHNSLLHEMCPEFFTPAITLYYAHVFYFQVLRARSAAGSDVLSRLEKRVLTFYERIGPAESWPVASPLLGFLEYLGAHKPEDPMFGWIVPALPDFMQFHATTPTCLANSNRVNGLSRIPLVPALQKVLYAFAHEDNDFEHGMLRPIGDDTLSATNVFCGITTSGITSDRFASISGNLAWFAPPETGDSVGPWDYDVKRNRLRRWNIPDVPDNADLSSLASFLGFTDNQGFDWMRQLLSMSGVFNRFFPGSGNLSQVSPLSTIGMTTMVKYNRLSGITRAADKWYYPRSDLKLSSHGFTNTDAGLLDTKMSITCSWNSEYSTAAASRVSVAPDLTLSPCRTGPFFNDDPAHGNIERKATIVTENSDQVDPCRRFLELITPMYDPKGGR
uniref:CP n=1 Tax=Camellia cryptic virus 2 TaxID=2809264 RepID=A0A890CCA4_9VIRU|nr:CP [Camellia cryptic virus 2]